MNTESEATEALPNRREGQLSCRIIFLEILSRPMQLSREHRATIEGRFGQICTLWSIHTGEATQFLTTQGYKGTVMTVPNERDRLMEVIACPTRTPTICLLADERFVWSAVDTDTNHVQHAHCMLFTTLRYRVRTDKRKKKDACNNCNLHNAGSCRVRKFGSAVKWDWQLALLDNRAHKS